MPYGPHSFFSRDMQRSTLIAFALLTLPFIVGCEGCRQVGQDPNAKKDDEKAPRTAYSTEAAIVYPDNQNAAFGYVKPGHWMTGAQSIRSNKADMRGQLRSHSSASVKNVDLEITGSIDSRDTIRPVVLPKGRMRRFDFRFRVPIPKSIETRKVLLSSRLVPRSGGVFEMGGQPFNVLQGAEYFFVILTTKPERFSLVQKGNWARASEMDLSGGTLQKNNYRVVIPDASKLLTVPETMLDMSSIAVILWDDLSEDALTPPQQQALADWVRFGGRLIVNGPGASEAVANTAIADLLPLFPTSNIELDQDAAIDLLRRWSVPTDRSLEKQVEMVRAESSRIAIDGKLGKGAVAIPETASLVLSRNVGRGHVIQPRFDLTAPWVEAWDSYDSFFNGVILNRPARAFVQNGFETIETEEELSLFFAGTNRRSDAAANSQFRIMTRDGMLIDSEDQTVKRSGSAYDAFNRVDAITGLSAWNDNSDSIKLLRDTLTGEAGIEIPGSALVIRSLAIYLVLLVPINYLVFRIMNRLEYAWFAVPFIAVFGAIFAARQARLDIGFARSNTELAVVETHAGYPRAHLTRMIGVYNSLSDRYELQFRTVDGIASPLDGEPDPGTTVEPVIKTSFEEGPSLDDFAVPSNRMRYVHTEEMVDLGGGITFDETQTLVNGTGADLLDGILVRRAEDGTSEIALVGGLSSGEGRVIEFDGPKLPVLSSDMPMQTDRLIRRFASPAGMPPGSVRLVARIDGALEGLEIAPRASQRFAQTLVIAHLRHPKLPKSTIDTNLPSDFRIVNRTDDSKKEDETEDPSPL